MVLFSLLLLLSSALVVTKTIPNYVGKFFHSRTTVAAQTTTAVTPCSIELENELRHINRMRDNQLLTPEDYNASRAAAMTHFANCRPDTRH
jgi:hypothetical protein